MSTQTQFTAKSAEDFLKKYATVVGTNKAVEDKNSDFLLKYATVVGTPEAVNTLIGVIDFSQKDIVLNNSLVTGKQINISDGVHTVNLNGNKITPEPDTVIYNDSDGVKTWSLLSISGSTADVTIDGNGSIIATPDDSYAIDVRDGAKVTIMDGEFVGNITSVYVLSGELTIKGGTYKIQQLGNANVQGGYGYVINCLDANYKNGSAKVSIEGGTFYGFNPANNPEGNGTSYVADGCTVVETNDGEIPIYTVVKDSTVNNE